MDEVFAPGTGIESGMMPRGAADGPDFAPAGPAQQSAVPPTPDGAVDARLVRLESADAWHKAAQEDTAAEVYELSRRVAKLESLVAALSGKLSQMIEESEARPPHDSRPPHY
jgi:uncharacterized coiled-coil protein SlyX